MTAQISADPIQFPDTPGSDFSYDAHQPLPAVAPTPPLERAKELGKQARSAAIRFVTVDLRQSRRAQLAAAASLFGLLVGAGCLTWLLSGRTSSHVIPAYHATLQSSADLARAPLPYGMRTHAALDASERQKTAAEIMQLGGPAIRPTAPISHPATSPAVSAVSAPPLPAPQAAAVTTLKPTVSTPPEGPIRPITPKPIASGVTPRDPVDVAAALKPGAMTDTQQVAVLELVTELGSIVRDQRMQILQLRKQQDALQARVDHDIDDLHRRIALSEARQVLASAGGAGSPPPETAAVAMPQPTTMTAPKTDGLVPAADASDTPAVYRYHIQAASPGLAMLSELDASGSSEKQIPVSPGAKLPGFGSVIDISQHGSAWVVKTDRGIIQ